MKKKILILNGSISELPIIQKAKEMGFYVYTTGNMPELAGHLYADTYIPADYSDKESILNIVKEYKIDHIVSCANDFGVITASYVAEHMGWKGHDSYETAKLLHHKDLFKQYCYEKNIPSPVSKVFTEKLAAQNYIQDCTYPIIVKATDLTGGKGIRKAENLREAESAIDNAFSCSREKHIVIEPFITGTQHTIDAFIIDRKVAIFTSCNCFSTINPYLIQSETLPATNIESVQDQLCHIIEDMAADLNLANGILALQYILCNGKPYIIEMMRRCFGNQFLTLMDAITGFPWEEAYIKAAIGEDCHDIVRQQPTVRFCGHHGIMATQNGVLKGYSIPEKIKEHLFHKIDMIKPGEKITNYLNEKIAYLYYSYDNQDEMNRDVQQFNDLIKVEYETFSC